MRRIGLFAAVFAVALVGGASFSAMANWQGTWHYYDDQGKLIGVWTAGCGAADREWGEKSDNKRFTQGCASES